MGAPLNYRNAIPDLSSSSSSPLHSLVSLSSSPPISPQSPTPLRTNSSATRHLISPTTSNPHPFSGSAKASLNSHPSFGKDQLRSKHLRGSPDKAAAAGHTSWALSGTTTTSRDDAFEQHFFDSSDDAPSSDWSAAAISQSKSTAPSSFPNEAESHVGLGIGPSVEVGRSFHSHPLQPNLGEPFQEPTSPTMGRNVKLKARTFSRAQTSSRDPFSAGAGSGSNTFATQNASPRVQRDSQRRRLTGSSPKKLSRATQTGQFGRHSSDDSSDEALPPWEQKVPSTKNSVSWTSVVERVFEDVNGYIELTKQGLTRIDPVIADLSKFVSFLPMRNEETMTSGVSRVSSSSSSSANPFERVTSSSLHYGSPKGRSRVHTGEQSSSSKLQLYLRGNRLQVFSSALFELHNLVVLTIGNNDLEELPPAIGQLINLRELNISQNRLRHLPAEIQKLRLTSFVHFPNPYEQPGKDTTLSLRSTFSQSRESQSEEKTSSNAPTSSMGPPALPVRSLSHHDRLSIQSSFAMAASQTDLPTSKSAQTPLYDGQVARCLGPRLTDTPRLPSLMEFCIRVLLEEDEDKILLEQYESGCLVSMNKQLDGTIIKSLEAARRSATNAWGRVRPVSKAQDGTWCSGVKIDEVDEVPPRRAKRAAKKAQEPLDSFDLFNGSQDSVPASMMDFSSADEGDDGEASNEMSGEEEQRQVPLRVPSIEEQLDRGDDSRCNPWFNRCPNPSHYSSNTTKETRASLASSSFDWPGPRNGGRIFSKPTVTRLEWVSHIAGVSVSQIRLSDVAATQDTKTPTLAYGTDCIPLLWRGCGGQCLNFLEK